MTEVFLSLLLALQIAMGAFDTLYHHELTERLAWRSTAARELKLHAVRNGFYSVLFLLAAWTEPKGLIAALVLGVLAVELVITLTDFVEEDMTRRLPASERVTHTLLAVNYGAILAFIGPMLWQWAADPTGLGFVSRDWLSVLMTVSGLGVGVFGVRDWLASQRAPRLALPDAAELVSALRGRQRIVVTGATGFIGTRLVAALTAAGHDVIALVRSRQKASELPAPITLVESLDEIASDTAIDAIVNLAGSPVADAPWTRRNRHRILRSRLKMGRAVERLVDRLEHPPGVVVTASAIGFYGECGDVQVCEVDRPAKAGAGSFSHRSCAAVEARAMRLRAYGVRVVALRIGLVLDHEGGMLARMLPAFDLGLGGRIGDGRQWMSWISRADVVRLIAHAVASPDVDGALNATAPLPVRNSAFTAALGEVLGRPAFMWIPAWPIRAVLGQMGREILLGSQRVLPAKALATGFQFRHAKIEDALAEAVGAQTNVGSAMQPTFARELARAVS
ncbi:MAG: TIGR01777 family oxidoreductase [Hyphomicrobiaceae bacterium]